MGVGGVKPEYQLTALGTLLVLAVVTEHVATAIQKRRYRTA
jgi:hypothetical protein